MSANNRRTQDLDGQLLSLIHRVSNVIWDAVGCCSLVLLVLAILFCILSGIRCD